MAHLTMIGQGGGGAPVLQELRNVKKMIKIAVFRRYTDEGEICYGTVGLYHGCILD